MRTRRHRHFNAGHAGAALVLDSRFITGLADGDPVATWADRSGNGNDATQAAGANRPSFEVTGINSIPTVYFDGSSRFLSNSNSINLTSGCLAVAVMRVDNTSFNPIASKASGDITFLQWATEGLLLAEADVAAAASEGVTGTINPQIAAWQWDGGSNASVVRNGVTLASNNAVAITPTNNSSLNIGFESVNYLTGYLSQLNVFQVALTPSQRRRIEHAAAFSFKLACN